MGFRFNIPTKSLLLSLLLVVSVLVPLTAVHAQSTAIVQGSVWQYITNNQGIVNVWRLALALIDIIVVAALIFSAFANIFRFQIKSYEIKQILPGLIIGIILANLSFFIMRLFIESSSVGIQLIGDITAQTMGKAMDNGFAGDFLVKELLNQLFNSLFFNTPKLLDTLGLAGAGVGGAAVIGGAVAGAFTIPGLAGGALIGGLLFMVVVLLPLIFYAILLFLLYLRFYILVVMFMTAPIAFFALGFPPLKGWWNKWWGTFWKWLLMGIASHVVIAFALLFLYYTNRNVAGTNTEERSMSTYLLVNGIALGLLYFANRIPFMWGNFFGILDMKKYVETAKNITNRGSRAVWDGGATAYAGIASNKVKGTDELKKAAARMKGASTKEIVAEAKRARFAALRDAGKSFSPTRQLEGAAIVFKNWKEAQAKDDEKAVKNSMLYNRLSRTFTPKTYIKDMHEFQKGAVEDNGDVKNLMDEYIKINDVLKKANINDPARRREIRAAALRAKDTSKIIDENPGLRNNPNLWKDFATAVENGKKGRREMGKAKAAHWKDQIENGFEDPKYADPDPNNAGKYLVPSNIDAPIPRPNQNQQGRQNQQGQNPPGPNPGANPYSQGSDPEDDGPEDSSGSGGGSTPTDPTPSSGGGGAGAPRAVLIGEDYDPLEVHVASLSDHATQQIGEEERQIRFSPEDREFLESNPATVMRHVSRMFDERQKDLGDALKRIGLSGARTTEILQQVTKKANDPNAKTLGAPEEYGLTADQLKDPAVKNAFQSYGRALRVGSTLMSNTVPQDSELASASVMSQVFSKRTTEEVNRVRETLTTADAALKATIDAPDRAQLEAIQTKLQSANLPHVSFLTDTKTTSSTNLQTQLLDAVKEAQDGLKIHDQVTYVRSQTGNDAVPIKDVVTAQRGTEVGVRTAARAMDRAEREESLPVSQNIEMSEPAAVEPPVSELPGESVSEVVPAAGSIEPTEGVANESSSESAQ